MIPRYSLMVLMGLVLTLPYSCTKRLGVPSDRPNGNTRRIINTPFAPKAIGPYSQAVEINGMLFISGQVPVDPVTDKIVGGGITEQAEQVMKNIGAILKAAGYEYSDVVKSTCLMSDLDNFKAMNDVYRKYYPTDPPARATFAVVKLPLEALIEIETIAVRSR